MKAKKKTKIENNQVSCFVFGKIIFNVMFPDGDFQGALGEEYLNSILYNEQNNDSNSIVQYHFLYFVVERIGHCFFFHETLIYSQSNQLENTSNSPPFSSPLFFSGDYVSKEEV